MNTIDKKQFWDDKVFGWERDKYDTSKKILGFSFDVNRSVKKRLRLAQTILSQVARNRTVLELGCGTARLLPMLVHTGVKKYIGVDISKLAIEHAQAKAEFLGASTIAEFHQLDVTTLGDINTDICFSLGLLDWLDLADISQMLQRIHCQYYIHSFSEKRRSVQLLLHRVYTYVLYGYRTKFYVPKYYTKAQMEKVFAACYGHPVRCLRSKGLSFGCFIFRLPEGIEFEQESHQTLL